MTDQIHEQISALVDGELSQAESELLFRRMEKDDALREAWQRYSMIHDAVHRTVPDQFDINFSSRVMAAIESEPAVHGGLVRAGMQKLLKPLAGLAVAASVAALAIVGLQNVSGVIDNSEGPAIVAGKADPSGFVKVSGTSWGMKQPEVAAKLNGYLVNHNEFSSSTNFEGILQYRRIVGYDSAPKK